MDQARGHLQGLLLREVFPELSTIQRDEFVEVNGADRHAKSVAKECKRAETGEHAVEPNITAVFTFWPTPMLTECPGLQTFHTSQQPMVAVHTELSASNSLTGYFTPMPLVRPELEKRRS